MSAPRPYLQQDAMGAFPSLLLWLLIVLAALGVVAHAAAI